MIRRLHAIMDAIKRLLSQPDEELDRWGKAGKNSILFALRAGQELVEDRAPQMAAALSYRTVFSLVPTLVLALVGLRVFYGGGLIEASMDELLDYLGLSEIAVSAPSDAGAEDGAGEQEGAAGNGETTATAADWIQDLVNRVQGLNFAAIGAVGALLLIYAALALLIEIERAFNIIYKAPRGRNPVGRVVNYWTILTLGPIGVIASFYVGERLAATVDEIGGARVFEGIGALVNFAISWLLLTLAYTIIPNTRVAKRPALTGAFVAAALWEIGKWGFTTYLDFSSGYARLYGSLALIPIFLLWIYITWLVILFGLEVSYAMQTLDVTKRRWRGSTRPDLAMVDAGACVAVLGVIARRFEGGEPTDVSDLSAELDIGDSVASRIARRLVETDLVRRVEGSSEERSGFTLGRPPEKIGLDEVVRVGRSLSIGDAAGRSSGWRLLERLRDAEMREAEKMTLADAIMIGQDQQRDAEEDAG